MWITSSDDFCCVALDFEFVTCASGRRHVWELGACVLKRPHLKFQAYVLPPLLQLPPCATNADLSHDWLRNNNAVTLAQAMHDFAVWLATHCDAPRVLFCAHGAFASDQPLLRDALARTGVVLPRQHFWLDTLQYVRHAFRADRLDKFTLQHLAQRYLNEDVQHSAEHDASQLVRVLIIAQQSVPLSGYALPTHQVALTLLHGVGPGMVQDLMRSGVPDDAEGLALYLASGREFPPFVSESARAALTAFARTACEQPCALQSPQFTASRGGTSTTCSASGSSQKPKPT